MTDRDRLIELCNEKISTMTFNNSDHWFDFHERICDMVDHLLANGVIVPPCKVGDWVWYIRDGKINKAKIEESIYSASKHGYFSEDWRFHAYNFSKKEEITFWLDNIGKTVFLTKEEAEQALKERADNG